MENPVYEIKGKKYYQQPLVIGQMKQIIPLLKEISIPTNLGIASLTNAFGDKITDLLAIILTEEGANPKDKDLKATAEEFMWGVETEQLIDIMTDFFRCNPLPSLLAKFNGVIIGFKGMMITGLQKMMERDGSTN